MSTTNIIRALKDPEYRESLNDAELAALPAHPAGLIELTDEDLESAAGGRKGTYSCTVSKGGGCSCTCSPPSSIAPKPVA